MYMYSKKKPKQQTINYITQDETYCQHLGWRIEVYCLIGELRMTIFII